jgi:catechol 2,3-dioxygenase-like lactoylglutathione lyase family enzyme
VQGSLRRHAQHAQQPADADHRQGDLEFAADPLADHLPGPQRVLELELPRTYYDRRVDTPVGQLMNIVVDCPDADISAWFWAAVLGWERVQESADAVDIADASDGRRRLVFQQIADYRPPGWPDQGPPQQLHLDVRVDDLEIAGQRVRALGAVSLGERVVLEDETYWVYADPAGHPFCLVQLETT